MARAWRRLGRLSTRARERVRGLPLRAAHRRGGIPIPPGRLIHLVAGTEDVSWFLAGGAAAAAGIREVLVRNGLAIESFGAVLDFGCGAGRVLRHWSRLDGPTLVGSDYNPALVAWCRRHLPFARFEVNGLDRPLAAGDASFDFIYALSVFTHLAEPLQRFWMAELTRVLRPGGHLLITTHGASYLGQLSDDDRARFRAGHAVVRGASRQGSNDCAVFHPESYVRRVLAEGLDVVDFLPEGARGNPHQDAFLLRKPCATASGR
jgi:SAM-dependent methyltransferase